MTGTLNLIKLCVGAEAVEDLLPFDAAAFAASLVGEE